MEKTYIKKFSGLIVGIVETDSNGDKTVKDFSSGKILGYYKKSRDVTTDFYGKILAYGDITGIFFKDHFNV